MAVVDELILGLGVKVDGSAFTKIAGFASVLATGVNQALEIANKIYRVFDDIAHEMEKVGVASLAMEQLSQRTGMSTDEIQAWTYAAVKMGGTAEDAASDLNNLAAAAAMRGKSLPAFLEEISGFMKGMPLVQAEVFGKGFGLSDSSIRLLQRGQVDFHKLLEDVKKSGAWISPETVKNGAEMERHLMVIRQTWDAIKANALGKAIGVVDQMLERLLKWIQGNKNVQDSLARFAQRMEDVAGLIYLFIRALVDMTGNADDLDGTLGAITDALYLMATALYLMATPVALLIGLVRDLKDGFKLLQTTVESVCAKIKNALGGMFEWLDQHPVAKALLYATNPALAVNVAAVDYMAPSNKGDNPDPSANQGTRALMEQTASRIMDNSLWLNPVTSSFKALNALGVFDSFKQQAPAGQQRGNSSNVTDNRQTTITVSGVSDPHQAAAMVVHKLQATTTVAPGNLQPAGGQ